MPNVYESKAVFVPTNDEGGANLGGLSALAGLAGISVGGGGKVDTFTKMQAIFDDYRFKVFLMKKYNFLLKK